MNTLDLNRALHCLPHFVGTFPRDKIPLVAQRPCSYVINLDDSNNDGSHWVALYVDNENNATYFDSYGRPPLPHCKDILNILSKLSQKQWKYNDLQYQNELSNVCGYYCTLFLILRGEGVTLNEFQKIFSRNSTYNDCFVKEIVHNYIQKHVKMLYK